MEKQEQLRSLFLKHGAFWAFGKDQFESQRKENVEYYSIESLDGLYCPKDTTIKMLKELRKIYPKKVTS